MHLPMNFKSPNNISKWQMGFNSAFKGLNLLPYYLYFTLIEENFDYEKARMSEKKFYVD